MFFGGVFSAEGYSPDLEKIQGISKMTPPQMKQELQSFLGAVNYLQTFVPYLSSNTEPVQALLKKENCFAWDENTNMCFQKIKSQLQKALLRPLRYYDWSKLVTLQCDALFKGLGACIIQDGQPIAFARKSLRTLRPTMPTSRENSWPLYMVVKNSTHTCTEGHSSWRQTISPSR